MTLSRRTFLRSVAALLGVAPIATVAASTPAIELWPHQAEAFNSDDYADWSTTLSGKTYTDYQYEMADSKGRFQPINGTVYFCDHTGKAEPMKFVDGRLVPWDWQPPDLSGLKFRIVSKSALVDWKSNA